MGQKIANNNRRKRRKLSNFGKVHLLIGCCLVHCELCSGGDSASRVLDLAAWTLNEQAGSAWRSNRDRLLGIWQDPAGRRPGLHGFSVERYRGAGRTGLPCFGELYYDLAQFPKLDRSWPRDVQSAWSELRDEVKKA